MRALSIFLLAAAAAFAADGRNIVDYRISAKLVPKDHAVEGHETLIWHNVSKDEIRELQFHLYMNAFRDAKSTFVREGGRADSRLKDNGWGHIDVKRLEIAGGADLTPAIKFIHPDDDNADDRTVISVALPQPVRAGGSITLDIDFYTKLPHVVARTGYHGTFYMVAQWFPKIGVWETAGDRYSTAGHWNCHQFHAHSEFYADYGRFDVSITTPSEYVVGATGVEQETKAGALPGTATHRFVQADVHEFAWTAQPTCLRITRTFDPAREVTPAELADTARLLGLPQSEVRLTPVEMIILLQPEHAAQTERQFRALRTGIKYFGLWYGAYPYKTITLVDPPHNGMQAGGMEYPTLITGGTSWLDDPYVHSPEGVIVHEFGHQFWYGLVGNNEFEESWLDEGFNTYSTDTILDLAYGAQRLPFRLLSVPLTRFVASPFAPQMDLNRAAYVVDPKVDEMVRNAWQYYSGMSYGVNSYVRPGITLTTLGNILGRQTMARVMRTYHQRWRYRHPTSLDFLKVVNEVSGRDMKWFFDQFVFGSNVVDYGVSDITSEKPEGKKEYESKVRVRRYGEAIVPVELRVRFTDGKFVNREWDGRYRWADFKFTGPAAVAAATVDPDRKILLDVRYANNGRTMKPQARPVMKWTENLVFWAEQLLLAVASIA